MPPKRKKVVRPRKPTKTELEVLTDHVKQEPGLENSTNGLEPKAFKCKECGKCFKHKNYFLGHLRRAHINSCKNCGKKFTNKTGKENHERRCKKSVNIELIKQPRFSCKECRKKFKFRSNYIRHIKNDHSKLPDAVSCNQCAVRCPNQVVLEEHIATIHERQIFECEHCTKKFVRHSHVLRHMAQIGCDGQGVSSYPCEICDAQFSRKDNLMVHLRQQHIFRKPFTCKLCDYSSRSFSKLIVHRQKMHSESPYQFECDLCGKSTSSRAAITKHLEIHGEKKFACDVCGYSTFTIEVMRRHVLTHVKDKPYKCPQCDQSFIQSLQLRNHIKRHSKNCRICDKVFASKSGLLLHVKKHLGTTQLFCPIEDCQYSKEELVNGEVFNNHMKQHVKDKPYRCEVCNKAFATESNMLRHVSSHKLERPRRCMYCMQARAYVRGEQLVRHVRKVHPVVFREHLTHVRNVLGINHKAERVKKSELDAILNVLDAETDRILQGYGEGVLYAGMQDVEDEAPETVLPSMENTTIMSEDELAKNLKLLLGELINRETLQAFGWPDESVDTLLEKVIEGCGARAADKEKWTRVQCLRENAKYLFLYVVEDDNIARMLDTHTIDQVVKHILAQVSDEMDDVKARIKKE